MKFQEPAPCIHIYSDVFDASEFISLLEQECAQEWGYLSWFQTTVGGPGRNMVAPEYRSSLGCELAPLYVEPENVTNDRVLPLIAQWRNMSSALENCIWNYRNTFNVDLSGNEGYRVLKYGVGAEYRGHIDHAPDNGRILSMVAFLNDVPNGGELTFPIMGVQVKPQAGTVVLFPSNFPYYHFAASVGENDNTVKYSLVTWFR